MTLENYYTLEELSHQIDQWVEYYNNNRYHEAIDTVTSLDRFLGKDKEILERRERLKTDTMMCRRKFNRGMTLLT